MEKLPNHIRGDVYCSGYRVRHLFIREIENTLVDLKLPTPMHTFWRRHNQGLVITCDDQETKVIGVIFNADYYNPNQIIKLSRVISDAIFCLDDESGIFYQNGKRVS